VHVDDEHEQQRREEQDREERAELEVHDEAVNRAQPPCLSIQGPPGKGKRLNRCWYPAILLFCGYRGLSPGVKRPGQ
jgi:hypothetical protein